MAARNMVLAGLFAALIAIGSQISFVIPPSPVPHTLQVFFVMLSGLILGSKWGSISVGLWILLGAFGLPVFAQGKAGLAAVLGPTGGFLLGFTLCAYVVGRITERFGLAYKVVAGAMVLGMIIVYTLGLVGFMACFQYFLHKPMTWEKAFMLTTLPFAPFDFVKSLFAGYIGIKVRRALIQAGYSA
ncbi:BioY family transporter [Anaerosporomusa subterranea]|uniref:Biotin transporter n=1 Tax=Anaerosporomusa subterranea TaxID=1794912 RepID=A0A154BWF9_ANASB|nr:biotin transporter BioY [Anaerosporomusa subterranea]KYZ78282.1 BioY family transporter [Anaerosporomusa subterranea]